MKLTLSLVLMAILIACSAKAENLDSLQRLSVTREVQFLGSCDASAAVTLSDKLFAVADDEDNVIRVYDATLGGAPLMQFDLSYKNHLKTTKDQYGRPIPAPLDEMDIEAATLIDGKALWITSHGRNKKGDLAPERLRFFATDIDIQRQQLSLTSPAVSNLLSALADHPELKTYKLQEAASKPPKAYGGLSLEGMTAMPNGELLLGFRNPVPKGSALLVILKNPIAVLQGSVLNLEPSILLDLDGLGVRGISYWQDQYLIAAGHFGEGFNPGLYTWSGAGSAAKHVDVELPEDFNTEAFFTPDNFGEFMLLSDDGGVTIGDRPCKKLKDANRKFFRGIWVKSTPKDSSNTSKQ